jgi:[ribosomal protein S5]-alanine N-acetyltransferase
MLRDVNASTDTADDRASVCTTSAPVQWWNHLPDLVSAPVRLRELRAGDAAALIPAIASPEVGKYLSPGPTSVAEIEMFIKWAQRARSEGRYICFGVVPHGATDPVGVFQLWPLEPSFRTAEWGFALDPAHWGTGLFHQCAQLVMEFGFDRLGMIRLEARAAADNARGNRALKKLGALPEGVLRKAFMAGGEYRDHVLWAILADDWRHQQGGGAMVAGEMA